MPKFGGVPGIDVIQTSRGERDLEQRGFSFAKSVFCKTDGFRVGPSRRLSWLQVQACVACARDGYGLEPKWLESKWLWLPSMLG